MKKTMLLFLLIVVFLLVVAPVNAAWWNFFVKKEVKEVEKQTIKKVTIQEEKQVAKNEAQVNQVSKNKASQLQKNIAAGAMVEKFSKEALCAKARCVRNFAEADGNMQAFKSGKLYAVTERANQNKYIYTEYAATSNFVITGGDNIDNCVAYSL